MNKQILVTGSDGMVGSRFVELFPDEDALYLPSEEELDITDKERISQVFNKHDIATVVNFAAYTDVNAAEKQRDGKNGICWKVNVDGVKNLVDAIEPDKTHFIQISTDMVFSGSQDNPGPYTEDTPPEKDLKGLTWYGYTKAEADRYVMDTLGEKATIVRILYPVRAKYEPKLDFLRKPLNIFDKGKLYPLIDDQQVTISFIDEISSTLRKIIDKDLRGIYHVASKNMGTPYEIIFYMLKQTRGVEAHELKKTSLKEYIRKSGSPVYRYPKYGGLDSERTQRDLSMSFGTWKQIIDKLVEQGLGE